MTGGSGATVLTTALDVATVGKVSGSLLLFDFRLFRFLGLELLSAAGYSSTAVICFDTSAVSFLGSFGAWFLV